MAKKREIPNLVEDIVKTTEQVSKEAEIIDKMKINETNVDKKDESFDEVYNQIEKKEFRTERVHMMITPSLKRRLQKAAERKGISMSEITIRVLEEFLNKLEKE